MSKSVNVDHSALFDRAQTLHAQAVQSFQSSSTVTSTKSDFTFLQKILQSGTLSDRLSALTLLVQSSPLHNTKALETLRSLAERGKGKGGREESLKALRCIVDWWVGGGAPDRKLKYFRDQLLNPKTDDDKLLSFYFEDWLKKYFFSVLQILETISIDPLPYVRTQALKLIYTLLREKPEQEHNLLRLLVNKLGDGEKSICSRTSYHILQLLQAHPAMKMVIIREITSLILQPGTTAPATAPASASKPPKKNVMNEHARYYGIITFNQITFTPADKDVALHLIDVYFRMFEDLLNEGKATEKIGMDENDKLDVEDSRSKLLSAILTGVNRALPFVKLDVANASLNKHIDSLFLITHTSTFNISLQALVLIQHISSMLASQSSTLPPSSLSKPILDRYYRTLYSSLHDGRVASSSKQTMYLNLLFKSLKADVDTPRVESFIRRFIQVLVSGGAGGPEFVVGGLHLLGELSGTVPGVRTFLQGKSTLSEVEDYDPRKRDPQFAHASSSPLYELRPLLHHYHPTISLHARQLLASQPITSSLDLTLNTLSHFVDRFVYKNPKKPKPKGASAMQPAASTHDGIAVKRIRGEVSGGPLPNDEKFWKRKIEHIPVDEIFFYKYFSQKNRKQWPEPDRDQEEGFSDPDVTDHSSAAGDEPLDAEADGDESGDGLSLAEASDDDGLLSLDDLPDGLVRYNGLDADGEDVLDVSDDIPDDLSGFEGSDIDEGDDDHDIPEGLIEYDGSVADGEGDEWGGIGGADKRKREDKGPGKRKKRKTLPTFASYDEYAKMIEDAPEDDI